jgi:hypothetical protein
MASAAVKESAEPLLLLVPLTKLPLSPLRKGGIGGTAKSPRPDGTHALSDGASRAEQPNPTHEKTSDTAKNRS